MKSIPLLLLAFLMGASAAPAAVDAAPASSDPSAGGVIDRLQLVGVPMGGGAALSVEDMDRLPFAPIEVLQFEVPYESGLEGRVFVFADVRSMETALGYLQGNPQIGDAPTWLFPYGRVLLQLDGRVPEEWAIRYQDAMYSLAWTAD
jgi:hypothetical protein